MLPESFDHTKKASKPQNLSHLGPGSFQIISYSGGVYEYVGFHAPEDAPTSPVCMSDKYPHEHVYTYMFPGAHAQIFYLIYAQAMIVRLVCIMARAPSLMHSSAGHESTVYLQVASPRARATPLGRGLPLANLLKIWNSKLKNNHGQLYSQQHSLRRELSIWTFESVRMSYVGTCVCLGLLFAHATDKI